MKAFIVAALLVGLTVAQTQTTVDTSSTGTCTISNETACANFTDSCCGTVSYKNGTAAAVTATRCISRHLTEAVSSSWWNMMGTNVTVSYTCLNATKPTGYTTYPACTSSDNCTSGYCCANMNYTLTNRTNVNITGTVCVPGAMGKDSGSAMLFKHNGTVTYNDITVQTNCYSSINAGFYSSAVILKSAVALAVAGIVSFAL